MFQPDLDAMMGEIRSRYGPGRYKLYIKWTDPKSGKRRMTAPDFVLAPAPEDVGPPSEPMPAGGDAGAVLDEAAERLQRAVRLKAQAAELQALGALSAEKPEGADGAPAVAQLRLALDLLKAMQPDTLGLLRTAMDVVRGTAPPNPLDQLGSLEKLAGIVERFAGGGGDRGGASGWDFAIEVLRQIGPALPDVVAALAAVRGVGAPPAPEPMPAPAPAPSPPSLSGSVQSPEQEPVLRVLLDLAWTDMHGPGKTAEQAAEGAQVWCDTAARLAPALLADLARLSDAERWALWSRLDPRVASDPAARAWVQALGPALREEGGSE